MHSKTKITPLIRREIFEKRQSGQKCKYLSNYYHVHINTITKICKRGKMGDFTVHKSTREDYRIYKYGFQKLLKIEQKILKIRQRKDIKRYEVKFPGELLHIDLHKIKNIIGEDPKKKKYLVGVIDDYGRYVYSEIIENKKAYTVSCFIIRTIKHFEKKGIKIKKILSDNGKEFTTHRVDLKKNHIFEKVLEMYGIKHVYTIPNRPQTNGKIERFWRTFNEMFFKKHNFSSFVDFKQRYFEFIYFYNYKKPHSGIGGLNPIQKLFEYKL